MATEAEVQRWQERLKDIPPVKVDPSRWPKHVRQISTDETDGLGIDADGRLYWNGKPVEIIAQRLTFSGFQKFWAGAIGIVSFCALFAQGWASGHEWMCKAGWIVKWCSPS